MYKNGEHPPMDTTMIVQVKSPDLVGIKQLKPSG